MGITVLIPGGFKPPHKKHYQLAKNFSKIPGVEKVRILVGPSPRDGISREDSIKVWNILLKNDPEIKAIPTEQDNPMQAAYATVENSEDGGDFFLAAGSKDAKEDRLGQFIKTWSRKVNGEKYDNFIKTGKEYPEKPTPEEKNILPNKYYFKLRNKLTNKFPKEKGDVFTAVDLPQSEIKKAQKPMYYKGRDDEFEGKEFSATALRKDILSGNIENFKTNYPGLDQEDIDQIYKILKGKVVPEEPKAKKTRSVKKENIADVIYENAINRLLLINLLKEGGNIFKTAEGKKATQDIDQKDIDPTIEWLEKITGLPLKDNKLGTTGKKDTSGDLDISVDEKSISKEDLISRLEKAGFKPQQLKSKKNPNPPKDYDIAKTGNQVHLKTPILGDKSKNKYVQTDFMFGNPEWMKFAKYAPGKDENSKYKGVHRAMLIYSIANNKGYKFSPDKGLQKRDSGEEFISDPKEVVKILLGPNKKVEDLNSVESIVKAIKDQSNYEDLVKDVRTGGKYEFEKYGATFSDQEDNKTLNEILKRLIESHIIREGAEARIQHPEDLVYWNGQSGAQDAIDQIEIAAKQPDTVAQKWDGSPAVVFGTDAKGNFFFSDKRAYKPENLIDSPEKLEDLYDTRIKNFQAKGKLNTPEQLSRYKGMVGDMKRTFETVKNSWPKGLKGVFSGDLMYTSKPEIENDKYVFKPNTVNYEVPVDSEIGKEIGNSEVGVILHSYTSPDGEKIPQLDSIDQFKFQKPGGNNKLLVFSPGKSTEPIKLDQSLLQKAKSSVSKLSGAKELLDPNKLKEMGISNLPDLLYAFTNASGENLEKNLNVKGFDAWVSKAPAGLSAKKIENIKAYCINDDKNRETLENVFESVIAISNLKNSAIQELDSLGFALPASIDGVPGGEGYVVTTDKGQIKLVNRGGFTAANRAKQR